MEVVGQPMAWSPGRFFYNLILFSKTKFTFKSLNDLMSFLNNLFGAIGHGVEITRLGAEVTRKFNDTAGTNVVERFYVAARGSGCAYDQVGRTTEDRLPLTFLIVVETYHLR